MARKERFTQDEVIVLLEARIGSQPQKEFAEELGISASFLSNVLKKVRLPDEKIATALGLQLADVSWIRKDKR